MVVVGADGEEWSLGEMGLELARNMSEGWYGAEGLSPMGVDVDGLPHVVEVETLVGNAVLLQSGSKAGFFLCQYANPRHSLVPRDVSD